MIKASLRSHRGNKPLELSFKTFTGGERQVKILGVAGVPVENFNFTGSRIDVYAYIDSSDAIMDLILFCNALERAGNGTGYLANKELYMPYIPYGRQDRVMTPGEASPAVEIGSIINRLGFDRVHVADPHSEVSASHIKRVVIHEQHDLVLDLLGDEFFEDVLIVAPDAGAIKKATKLAQKVGHSEIGVGSKHRNLLTNEITGTSYSGPDVSGKRVVMVDDLADGARTFLELAGVLKNQGAKEVILYVTHGIFSYGVDICEGVIEEVYAAFPWEKNISGRNEKGILKKVDVATWFK